MLVNLQAAEGEGDTAGDGVPDVGRGVEGKGPVGLGRVDSEGALAVEGGRVEAAGLHRVVELADRTGQPFGVDAERAASSGIVSDSALETWGILYSSRSSAVVFASNSWKAAPWGRVSISRPYLA